MSQWLDRQFVIHNVMDRIEALERKLHDLGEGPVLEVHPDEDPGDVPLNLTEGPDIDVVGSRIGRGGDSVLLFDSAGDPVAEFAATSAGLDAASAAATAGDVVWLPAVTITGNHALTASVHYIGAARFGTILSGQITGAAGASLEQCSIIRTANDAGALYGIVTQATGIFYVSCVHVSVAQSGAGNAHAVHSAAGGMIELWQCYLNGDSVGGDGYGTFRDVAGGSIYIEGGVCLGSSSPCNE